MFDTSIAKTYMSFKWAPEVWIFSNLAAKDQMSLRWLAWEPQTLLKTMISIRLQCLCTKRSEISPVPELACKPSNLIKCNDFARKYTAPSPMPERALKLALRNIMFLNKICLTKPRAGTGLGSLNPNKIRCFWTKYAGLNTMPELAWEASNLVKYNVFEQSMLV